MANYLLSFFILMVSFNSSSGQVSINLTGAPPDSSAMLDIRSVNKGFLAPRMTTAQRNAIPSPATGLLVFDTSFKTFFFFNGAFWIATSVSVILADNDFDTKVQVEKLPDEDKVRIDLGGIESLVLRKNASGNTIMDLTESGNNILIGKDAGSNTTTGISNTGFGYQALFSNTTGAGNTSLGIRSLHENTSGSANIAIGVRSLFSNTTKSSLVAVGDSALMNNGQEQPFLNTLPKIPLSDPNRF